MSTSGNDGRVAVGGDGQQDFHFKYTVQKGSFMQSEDETDDKTFDFVRSIWSAFESTNHPCLVVIQRFLC